MTTSTAPTADVTWRWYDGELPTGDVLAWDVETAYFENGSNDIIQIGVSNGEQTVIANENTSIQEVFSQLSRCSSALVTHNGWWADVPWSNTWLEPWYGSMMPWGQDTMVLGYLADERQSLSLKSLCMKYLGVEDWKEGINAPRYSEEFALYNARDACYTHRLFSVLVPLLGDRKLVADRIIFPAFLALNECTRRGIYIDPEAVNDAEKHFKDQISRLQDRFSTEHGITKPRSAKALGEALVREGHSLSQTVSGQYSTGRATVARLKTTPLVSTIREFRLADKAYSAFVKPYKKLITDGDGRAHSEYTVIRTVTGRTSSRNPNIQQLPRESALRSFFSAPPGYQYISADYAAIEFRVAAWVAGEESILQRYRQDPGFDPHTWMAARIWGIPESDVTREQRQIAKSANFGLLYMAKGSTLREYVFKTTGIVLSPDAANNIRRAWHAEFPAFKRWYMNTWEGLKELGYVQSATGRRRNFGSGIIYQPYWKRAADLREAVNFQVQSLAADIALIGLAECHRQGLPINGFIHDSVSFEVKQSGIFDHAAFENWVTDCMVRRPVEVLKDEFGIDFDVPLTIEVK